MLPREADGLGCSGRLSCIPPAVCDGQRLLLVFGRILTFTKLGHFLWPPTHPNAGHAGGGRTYGHGAHTARKDTARRTHGEHVQGTGSTACTCWGGAAEDAAGSGPGRGDGGTGPSDGGGRRPGLRGAWSSRRRPTRRKMSRGARRQRAHDPAWELLLQVALIKPR